MQFLDAFVNYFPLVVVSTGFHISSALQVSKIARDADYLDSGLAGRRKSRGAGKQTSNRIHYYSSRYAIRLIKRFVIL
jgi:hypothetical protein